MKRNFWQLLAGISDTHLLIAIVSLGFLNSQLQTGRAYDFSSWLIPLLIAFMVALVCTAKLRGIVADGSQENILTRIFRSTVFPFAYALVLLVGLIISLTVQAAWVYSFWVVFRVSAVLMMVVQLFVVDQATKRKTKTLAQQ